MDKTTCLTFSDAETDAIALQALQAAYKCIKNAAVYDGDARAATRDILLAFKAANAIPWDALDAANESATPGTKYFFPHIDVHHVVATAVHFAGMGVDLEDVDPYSMAGSLLTSFAQACQALDAYANVVSALNGDGLYAASSADDVLKLLDEDAAP